MADKINGEENSQYSTDGPPSNLEGFIKSQIEDQEKNSKTGDNLDTEKRDSFIARAIAESRRMNKEIEKSKEKRSRLHAELGEKRMTEWREEHSSQVLTPQQAEMVERSYQDD
ncbi:uncharacterized protein LOC101858483 [Aplysia californica]|uniref:Uncharacterized protein LOC101858483 n=1 Tax=Aplysia californica TaxID=6500 RepID=A0ABM0JL50_APLCA|nr:uncharacterized protein LOC101858483 [Aplysia californica]